MKIKLTFLLLLGLYISACKSEKPKDSIVTPSSEQNETLKVRQVAEPVAANPAPVRSSVQKKDTVAVNSLEALVENAKENTTVILKKGKYQLEEYMVYYMTKDERKIIDKRSVETQSIGGQLFFSGLKNFNLIAENGTEVVSKNPKAVPFFVVQGKNLTFSNFRIRKNEQGSADLCYVSNSQNVVIDQFVMDGGGTYGMNINNLDHLEIKNCKISNCSTGILKINNSRGVHVMNSDFSNNKGQVPGINVYGNGSVVDFKNVTIRSNTRNPNSKFQNSDRLFAVGYNMVKLENCVIENNQGYQYLGLNSAQLSKSTVDGLIIE